MRATPCSVRQDTKPVPVFDKAAVAKGVLEQVCPWYLASRPREARRRIIRVYGKITEQKAKTSDG